MSVGFFQLTPRLVFLGGRAEALWLDAFLDGEGSCGGSVTHVTISADSLKEGLSNARGSSGGYLLNANSNYTLSEAQAKHKKMTRELGAELKKMLAEQVKKAGPKGSHWFELEVLW
jgi:hypothetical protein